MSTLLHWLGDHALLVAFVNVLLSQLGAPLPAYPVLIVTGALGVQGLHSPPALLATAVAACLVADLAWYAAGRRFGGRIVRTVCRLSISPDSCVRQTESLFARWGVRSLLVAKFIPGFAAIATTLAGNQRVPLATFVAFDAIGASLYAGLAIGLGVLFHDVVGNVLAVLAELGRIGVAVVVAGFALYVAVKWWQRYRLIRQLRMARITVPELTELVDAGRPPVILDVRGEFARARDGIIPGALVWPLDGGDEISTLTREAEVVVYCDCPNEVSAARVARRLHLEGFRYVRPLHGGIDAWIEAGRPVQRPAEAAQPAPMAVGS